MRCIRLRPKQTPVLAASPRWKQAKHEPLAKTDRSATELVGVHTHYDHCVRTFRQPQLQLSILKVRRVFIVPILVHWGVVFNWLPKVQASGDDTIWPFNAPWTLNVQREVTYRTAITGRSMPNWNVRMSAARRAAVNGSPMICDSAAITR